MRQSVYTHTADLTKYASHVYVLVRREELRASKIMAKRLVAHPKVTVLWNVSEQQSIESLYEMLMLTCRPSQPNARVMATSSNRSYCKMSKQRRLANSRLTVSSTPSVSSRPQAQL